MVAPYSNMLSADMKKQFKNTRKENKAEGDKSWQMYAHCNSHGPLPLHFQFTNGNI